MTTATESGTKPSICLIAHFAYGALTGGRTGHVGGAERQTTLMARWLAARGYRMNLLTWDEGQPREITIDGVRAIKMCARDAGMAGLRFFHPRWTSLCTGLRRADADVYYHNSAEYVTGQVAAWCRMHGRKFVYSVASDPACDSHLPLLKTFRERFLYRYGLRKADRVIVQTHKQTAMLREGWGLDSVVLPMPCSGPREGDYRDPDPPNRDCARVVWVGRISSMKLANMPTTRSCSAIPKSRRTSFPAWGKKR